MQNTISYVFLALAKLNKIVFQNVTLQVTCSVPEPQCFVPGECQGSVDHLEETASQEACLDLCKSREGCRWFTFHRPTSACILYHNCDTISTECNECVSGESRCESGSTTTTSSTTTSAPGSGEPAKSNYT